MGVLFKKTWSVTVDTIKTTDLDVEFKIVKSLKAKPNTCELKIYNLTPDMRASLEELTAKTKPISITSGKGTKKRRAAARKQVTKGIPCKIEAGYDGDNSLLWLGDLRTAHSERSGTDWVTTLESGDGEKAWQNARVHVSYGPMTPVDTALRAIVKTLGLGEGNIVKAAGSLKIAGKMFTQGTVFSGPTSRLLTDFCRSADLEWSIQDGAIQILDRGKALASSAVLVSEDTGMIDSPSVDIDGVVKVKMLMTPDIRPGRLIVIDSEQVTGGHKIEKITWHGASDGNDWEIEIEAIRY